MTYYVIGAFILMNGNGMEMDILNVIFTIEIEI